MSTKVYKEKREGISTDCSDEKRRTQLLASVMQEDANMLSLSNDDELMQGQGGSKYSKRHNLSVIYGAEESTIADSTLDQNNVSADMLSNSLDRSQRQSTRGSLIDPALYDLYSKDDRTQTMQADPQPIQVVTQNTRSTQLAPIIERSFETSEMASSLGPVSTKEMLREFKT